MEKQEQIFKRLICLSKIRGFIVRFKPLKYNYGRLKGNRIAIAENLPMDKVNFTLAHELAHAYLHYDKGNILNNDGGYEEQADRGALMLLEMASIIDN